MTDWLIIRVVLTGGGGRDLDQPPGRLMLVHADHSFADLAEAIDVAFGRWDLSHLHEFGVEGRELISPGGEPLDEDTEDSEDVTVGEVGLRAGARFSYVFDLGDRWHHDCLVEEMSADPFEAYGEEPDSPVPVWGWGWLPDQYWRLTAEDDDEWGRDDTDETTEGLATWEGSDRGTLQVVETALAGVDRPLDRDALAGAVEQLRVRRDADTWVFQALWGAAHMEPGVEPHEDATLWTALAAGVISPAGAVPLDPNRVAEWAALEPADWAAAVIELVRGGPGQPADPGTLLELIAQCPEVEDSDLSQEDEKVLVRGLTTVVALLNALGAIDDDGRLTPLGHWGLPEALRLAWSEERP